MECTCGPARNPDGKPVTTTTTTPKPPRWGITNDYGPLRDVLLGVPEFYRILAADPADGDVAKFYEAVANAAR